MIKNNNPKKIWKLFACGILCVSLSAPAFAANSISDAKKEKDKLENQLSDVQQEIENLQSKSQDTAEYMEQLDKKLTEITAQLVSLEQQIEEKQSELEQNQAELTKAQETSEKQYDDMKKRIKFLYENGSDAYFEMLLDSKDFADFVNKADFVQEMSEYDRNMLTSYQQTQQIIADKQVQIENEYKQIEQLQAETEEQKNSVQLLAEEKEKEYAAYQNQLERSEELASAVEAQIEAQENVIANLEAAAAKKAAEEAAAKKAAQEAAKKASQSAKTDSSDTASTTGSSDNNDTSSDSQVSSSGFVWPCPSSRKISSDYGYRIHPISGAYKLHGGIDVSAPTGTPIVAAASGTVTAAAYNSSMGNYVMISHGDSLFTVYMHCSGFNVSSGQTVSAGQTIAYVGSTGNSTGPHLHFSVRVNGSYVNPWNYVD